MCGICGFFFKNPQNPDVSEHILTEMTHALTHRGPDDFGYFQFPQGGLGHRRLTIVDLINGQQPMKTEDGRFALVFNGEIYNYLELKKEYLAGEKFKSSSDTEVLLHLMKLKGGEAIPLLNGMFAFAFYDIENRKVIFARDPVGQKPLFYFMGPNSFVFSSELSSLALHPDVPLDIDVGALARYLCQEGYPHPCTPLKSVHKLSPGHFLVLDLDNWGIRQKSYWNSFVGSQTILEESEDGYLNQFEAIFEKAVDRHLRSDVNVGIFLSAGLDSNSIVKAACKLRGADAVQTFTIRHELEVFDEADKARQTADYFGIRHHEKLLKTEEFLFSIEELLESIDEPIADPGLLANYQVTKFSSEFAKVVLSGNGGDEFFAGYAPFHALGAYKWAHAFIPDFAVNFLQKIAAFPSPNFDYMSTGFKLQRFLRGVTAQPHELLMRWIGSYNQDETRRILNKNVVDSLDNEAYFQTYENMFQLNPRLKQQDLVATLLYSFQQNFLPTCICNHSDKASMHVSQELRSPFLDVEVMRFANSIPSSMKYNKGKTKYILRKYLEKGAPRGVAENPKQGFTIPIAHWLTTSLKSWANEILDPQQIASDGLFNPMEVRRLWNEHQKKQANHAKALWTLITFQYWMHNSWANWKLRRSAALANQKKS
jgi:asparagine synthase (glutamine-hydrolysing)